MTIDPSGPAHLLAGLGVVVIGRNEGERLRRCLLSIAAASAAPVVYVDSGSTDGSPALAEALGAAVVQLNPVEPFTAARGRNEGRRALAALYPDLLRIQFIDGDCELLPGWIERAAARLAAEPRLAVVAGRRRERFPDGSIFNRLCDMEWNTPVGPAAAVGGDAMYRLEAFDAVGGFNPRLICGEEPELCFRLRRAGWGVERLDADMTLHDAVMLRWSQWFRRTVRTGWAFEEGAAMHGSSAEGYGRRQRRSLWLWGAAVPGAILGAAFLAVGLGAAGSPLWSGALGTAVAGVVAYALMALRIALRRRARFGDPWPHALLYGVFVMLGKTPEALGALRCRRSRRRGASATLIEYKAAG